MSAGCVLCMCRLYLGSLFASDVVGYASGLKANDSTQSVIQSMSDAPESSCLSFSRSLSFFDPVNLGTLA